MRPLMLLLLVILPGLGSYYLFPEWAALEASYQNYRQIADTPTSTLNQILIAQTAQDIHRINCFAEGVGLLLGGVIVSVGIHGLCTLPHRPSRLS